MPDYYFSFTAPRLNSVGDSTQSFRLPLAMRDMDRVRELIREANHLPSDEPIVVTSIYRFER